MRTVPAVLALALALLPRARAAEASSGKAPRPLHLLARDVEKGEADARAAAFAALLGRENVWARDLVVRGAARNSALAAKHLDAAVVATLNSHYFREKNALALLRKLWSGSEGGPVSQRAKAIRKLGELYAPRPSGLVLIPEIAARRQALLSILEPADLFEHHSALMELLGEKLPPPEVKIVRAELELLASGNGPVPPRTERRLDVTRAVAARRLLFAEKLDPHLAALLVRLRKEGEKAGWGKMLPSKWERISQALGLCSAVGRHYNALPSKSDDALEDLVLSMVARLGSSPAPELGSFPKDEKDRAAFLNYWRLTMLCARVSERRPLGYRKTASIAKTVDFRKLGFPLSCFVADARARENDAEARKFVVGELKSAAGAAPILALERTGANEDDLRRAIRAGELKVGVLKKSLARLAAVLAVTRPKHNEFAKLEKRLAKLAALADRFRKLGAAAAPVPGAADLGSVVQRLTRDDDEEEGGPDGKPRTSKRDAAVKAVKLLYERGEINLGKFLDRMDALGALDDPDLYSAYKKNVTGRDTVTNRVAACRLIGYRGEPGDSRLLNVYTLTARPEVLEAAAAAAARQGYHKLLETLLPGLEDMKLPSARRTVALLFWKVSRPKDVATILRLMSAEKDERFLEYLALGVRRHCAAGKLGPAAVAKVAEALKQDDYGNRWFHLASVLRSLAPGAKLELDSDTKPGSEARVKQVEAATAVVLKILKAGRASPAPAKE